MSLAIVLSGGVGSRVGADVPKQYLRVCNKPIVAYTLEKLQSCPDIEKIVTVVAPEWEEGLIDLAHQYGISKLCGTASSGTTRQESALNGLRASSGLLDEDDIVVIHDAARPLVSAALLESCIAGCEGHDGCMPALNITDTTYLSEDGKVISGLLDRSKLFAGQSPEAFRFGPYYKINRLASSEEIATCRGSSEIAFTHGLDIAIIPGDPKNFKITTASDLDRFAAIVKEAI